MSESADQSTGPKRRLVSRKKPQVSSGISHEPISAGALNDMVAPALAAQKAAARGIEPVSTGFLACAGVGFVLACFGPLENQLALLGVLGPIGATIAYPVWGWMAGLHKVPSVRERFADNCYYLGFIFTQLALVIGFMPVALWGKEIGSQDVLRFFGLALGASLVGLVARAFFVQTAHSISENADIVEQEVDLLARAISHQSKKVLVEFDAITERLGETYRKLNKDLELCAGSIAGAMSAYEASLRRDMGLIAEGAESVGHAASATRRRVEGEEAALVGALRSTSQAIEQLAHGLHEQVAGAAQAIRSSTDSLAMGVSALQGVSGLSQKLDAVEGRLGGVFERTDQLDEALVRAEAAISGAAARSLEAGQSLVAGTQAVLEGTQARAVEQGERLKTQVSEAVGALETTLASFRAELERIRV